MSTYAAIRQYVVDRHGFRPMNGMIAALKERHGLPVRQAWNRNDPTKRVYTCPADQKPAIEHALKHFGLI